MQMHFLDSANQVFWINPETYKLEFIYEVFVDSMLHHSVQRGQRFIDGSDSDRK